MQSPSNSQLKAINHGEGPMLVLAGPGSGKTFVMVQRILNLIHEKHVKPENILVISFSKASALELKQRFEKQFQKFSYTDIHINNSHIVNNQFQSKSKSQRDHFADTKVNFSTFHACFFHILKETYHYSASDIITEKQKRELLKTVLKNPIFESKANEIAKKPVEVKENITEKIEDYLQKISYYKNKDTKEMKEKESLQFQQIFQAYNQEMHSMHKLDFDDMGLLCLQLFIKEPKILEKWQDKFPYILIDEFQDINMVQFRIIQLLAGKRENLFVVGDDDQSIYSFRGSSPKIMLNFEKYYPAAQKVLLETNYRCSEEIVKESLKVIEQNKLRFQKEIKSFQKTKEKEEGKNELKKRKNSPHFSEQLNTERVIYRGFDNYHMEYSYIAEKIKELGKGKKYQYSDMACIFRTNQDMLGLSDYFVRNKIPFIMKESCNSIFKHFVSLDIMSYFQFFLAGKKRKDFLRIMNKPLRYLSRNALYSMSEETIVWNYLKKFYISKQYMVSVIEQLEKNERMIQKLDLYGICFYIRKVIGYDNYIKEYAKEQGIRWEEIKEILDFIQESTRNMNNLEEWEEYIERYEKALKEGTKEKEGVHMITMHACKGLEYPVVFIPDCNEGKIPHKKAAFPEEIEEERRMFYVAMTRAKVHLEILYIEDKLRKHLQVSRFISTLIPKFLTDER